jgi:transcriptional regulator with XRE-family HTH domain
VNSQSSLVAELKSKQYRDAFVASQIRISLPMQCRALRESRDWTQPKLAEEAGMTQPRISEIERPGERKPNLETLLRLASAFDVALQVRFVPFSKLVDDDNSVDFDNFSVEPFSKDIDRLEKLEEQMKSVAVLKVPQRPSAINKEFVAPSRNSSGNLPYYDATLQKKPSDESQKDIFIIEKESSGYLSDIAS